MIAAGAENAGGVNRGWVRAFDPDGNVVWTQTHAGPSGALVYSDVAIDSSDRPVVTGNIAAGGGETNAVTRKYDFDGVAVWTDVFQVGDASNQFGQGVAIDSNDFILLTATDNSDISVRRLNEDADPMWEDTVSGNGSDAASKVAVDGEGSVIAIGRLSQPDGTRIWVRKYSSEGSPQWTRLLDDEISGSGNARDVAVDGDGNVVLCAFLGFEFSPPTIVRKYDDAGTEQWTDGGSVDGLDFTDVVSVATDGEGNVVITGLGGDGANEIAIGKYSGTGLGLWAKTVAGTGSFDVGRSIAVDTHDNVLVAATIMNGSDTNGWVAKLAP